jgi:copper oxidase (laccase) domain-containing protein
VKKEFMKRFLNLNDRNRKFFYFKKTRIFFDLKEFIKSQLRSLKISNIDIINKDTFKNRTEFFSARRALKNKEDDYGRNISIIMLK